ncbi:MAG TPA: peptide chain release factor 1 [Candidatus Omnitrophica bacterium]|nr:peptide chain release factor 1 [Candidatus Omnitrophota bacterium]
MIDFEKLKKEYEDISHKLSSPEVLVDRAQYQQLVKRFSFLEKIINLLKKKQDYLKEEKHLKEVISNPQESQEVKELAEQELEELDKKLKDLEEEIEEEIFSQEEEERDVIIEIRSAAGGEEAALFCADLFKMYSKYIEKKGWKLEVLSSHPTEIGGFKEIIFSIKGKGAFTHLKFESGVHRVQRVPVTESGGRIHTSTSTIAVLVEPKEVELKISPEDLKIETFRASGHGGQHVNVTDSAVRITHIPSGIVVSCQDERSQIKNREKAMRVLKARLLDKVKREEQQKISHQRKIQIGTGERSEKIRTYNFPEKRVTDHRINFTLYRLDEVLEGELDEIIKRLIREERKKIFEEKGLS